MSVKSIFIDYDVKNPTNAKILINGVEIDLHGIEYVGIEITPKNIECILGTAKELETKFKEKENVS